MSATPDPPISEQHHMGKAIALKYQWSTDRNELKPEPWPHPDYVLSDTFPATSTNKWYAKIESGAGAGTLTMNDTTGVTYDADGMKVAVPANTRFLATSNFNITPKQKLAFEGYFSYASPTNTKFVNMGLTWEDDGTQHNAALRYDTFNKTWQYLPSTSTNIAGPWTDLPNGSTTLASGTITYFFGSIDFANDRYGEFTAGQIGVLDNSSLAVQQLTGTREQQVRMFLGGESSASGAGNIWFDDVHVWPID